MDFGKGAINEICGYVCSYFSDYNRKVTYSDNEHGMCECHVFRKEIKEDEY